MLQFGHTRRHGDAGVLDGEDPERRRGCFRWRLPTAWKCAGAPILSHKSPMTGALGLVRNS
jgi:hypothetical protein